METPKAKAFELISDFMIMQPALSSNTEKHYEMAKLYAERCCVEVKYSHAHAKESEMLKYWEKVQEEIKSL